MKSDITNLPDGSAFFTSTVMSKSEAMALPLKDRPLCFRLSSEIYHAVFETVGHASMCWKPRPSTEVFDSEKASKAATDLCFIIANDNEKTRADLESQLQQAVGLLTFTSKRMKEYGMTTIEIDAFLARHTKP